MMKSHEWRKIGERKGRLYFFYEKSVLDLTTFADQHPGGRKALANYAGKDITNVIFTVYPHNQ